jgi:hypothetical protein
MNFSYSNFFPFSVHCKSNESIQAETANANKNDREYLEDL